MPPPRYKRGGATDPLLPQEEHEVEGEPSSFVVENVPASGPTEDAHNKSERNHRIQSQTSSSNVDASMEDDVDEGGSGAHYSHVVLPWGVPSYPTSHPSHSASTLSSSLLPPEGALSGVRESDPSSYPRSSAAEPHTASESAPPDHTSFFSSRSGLGTLAAHLASGGHPYPGATSEPVTGLSTSHPQPSSNRLLHSDGAQDSQGVGLRTGSPPSGRDHADRQDIPVDERRGPAPHRPRASSPPKRLSDAEDRQSDPLPGRAPPLTSVTSPLSRSVSPNDHPLATHRSAPTSSEVGMTAADSSLAAGYGHSPPRVDMGHTVPLLSVADTTGPHQPQFEGPAVGSGREGREGEEGEFRSEGWTGQEEEEWDRSELSCFICLGDEHFAGDELISCCTQCHAAIHRSCWRDLSKSQRLSSIRARFPGHRVPNVRVCTICKTGFARTCPIQRVADGRIVRVERLADEPTRTHPEDFLQEPLQESLFSVVSRMLNDEDEDEDGPPLWPPVATLCNLLLIICSFFPCLILLTKYSMSSGVVMLGFLLAFYVFFVIEAVFLAILQRRRALEVLIDRHALPSGSSRSNASSSRDLAALDIDISALVDFSELSQTGGLDNAVSSTGTAAVGTGTDEFDRAPV